MSAMRNDQRPYIHISTERIKLTIGSKEAVQRERTEPEEKAFAVTCEDPVFVENGGQHASDEDRFQEEVLGFYYDFPINFIIHADKQEKIALNCTDEAKVSMLFNQNGLLVAELRVQSLGACSFHIALDGEEYMQFELDIFPKRVEYQNDFHLMREDVSRIFVGEAFGVYLAYLDYTLGQLRPGWKTRGGIRPIHLFSGKVRYRSNEELGISAGLGRHWNSRLTWQTNQARWINRVFYTVAGQIEDMRSLDPDAVTAQLEELGKRRTHPVLQRQLEADAAMEPADKGFVSSIAALLHSIEFGKLLEKYTEMQIAEIYCDWCYIAIYRNLCRALDNAAVHLDNSDGLCTIFDSGLWRFILKIEGPAIVLTVYFGKKNAKRYLFYPDYFCDDTPALRDTLNFQELDGVECDGVCGRWILYPGEHNLSKPGKIPLLPQMQDAADELIRQLVQEYTVQANSLDSFDQRDVLIGVLRNRKQIEDNVRFHFYHIPAQNIPPEYLSARWIALYQSPAFFEEEKSGVRIYGEVESCRLVRRGEIREIPTNRDPQQLYYRFDIKKWHRLDKPILPGDFGPKVGMVTNCFLLHHARCVPELYIQNTEQWRLYCLLKQYFSQPQLVLEGQVLRGFAFDGNLAEIGRGIIRCRDNAGALRVWLFDEMRAKPDEFAEQFLKREESENGKG